MLTPYPWQQTAWRLITRMRDSDRIGHAMLLHGPHGIGLDQFARVVSASLLCHQSTPDYLPCGECKSCRLLEAGNHTDCVGIEPEEAGKQIRVEQIRELIGFINLKSRFEKHKIAVINPADNMNRHAANTLLKTLEEPPSDSLLLLLTHRPDHLPVTIRSRCQQLYLRPSCGPDTRDWLKSQLDNPDQAEHYLLLAGGAPLSALEMANNKILENLLSLIMELEDLQYGQADPVRWAEKWNREDAGQVLLWLVQILQDLVRMKSQCEPLRFRGEALEAGLQCLENRLDLNNLLLCYDLLLKNYHLARSQVSFNSLALLEDFSIYWQTRPVLREDRAS